MTHLTRTTTVIGLAAVLLACATQARAGGDEWMTNYKDALKLSQETGKPILADFTGSDWCGWCIKLNDEVFSKPEFGAWAKENVILLELDYPNRKKQPQWLKQQNAGLAKKYGIRGYPTILLLNGKGEVLGKTGYRRGGAEAWIEHAQQMIDEAVPKPVEFEANLTDAIAKAKAETRGLVVVTEPKATDATARKLKALSENPDFIELANGRLALVYLPRADKEGNAADEAQLEALDALAKQLELVPGKVDMWVVDPTGDQPELLVKSSVVLAPKSVIAKTKGKLPVPKYEGGWLTDFEQAKAISAKTGKPMLLDFTGSDWCGWCIKLDKEVFETEQFKQFADENLVLVKLDFPRKKKLPADEVKRNRALMQRFGVRGFPTLIVLNSDDKQIGKLGYMRGGPEPFIEKTKSIIAQ